MSTPDLTWLDNVNVAADASVIPKKEQLFSLAKLAIAMRAAENTIEDLELELEQAKSNLKALSEDKIPSLMQEIGIEKLTLSNGLKLSYKFFANGKILNEAAYDEFENNGFADLVKNNLTIKSRRIEKQDLQPIRDLIREHGLEFEEKDSIHYQTMGAFLREQIENGGWLPSSENLEIFRGFKASVK